MIAGFDIPNEGKKSQPSFSMTEAANIIGVATSTVSRAVKRGTIDTVQTNTGRKRIPASEVIKYANKTDKDVEAVAKRVQEETGGSDKQLLTWILVGLGLYFLIRYLQES